MRRFGFVTTNSITQVFQRRVVERHLGGKVPISLLLAIPDHPWTKATKDAASVRIAMTVAAAGNHDGILRKVTREEKLDTDEPRIEFTSKSGKINPDLTIGVDVTKSRALVANEALCSPGVKLHGDGFIVSRKKAMELGLGRRPGLERHIKEYRNGRDLTAHSRDVMVIDFFGVEANTIRRDYPEVYQHLLTSVKPERDKNNRASYRDKWWCFGEPRKEMRPSLKKLHHYIATVETMKHRVFQFIDASIIPDNKLIVFSLDEAHALGILSSKVHVIWATLSGGWLGVGNDPVYVKSRCFDPFPFPDATETAKNQIGMLAEELDSTRKLVLAENPDLTLTILYNVLELSQAGISLSPKERDIQTRGRVLILKELHDHIDEAVMRAYRWPLDLTNEQIIERLVELNQVRASEERRGFIKWLRPDYQIAKLGPLAHRADRIQSIAIAGSSRSKNAFPTEWAAQAGNVLDLLSRSREPLTAAEIASQFEDQNRITPEVNDVLTSLNSLGQIETFDNGRSYIRIAS